MILKMDIQCETNVPVKPGVIFRKH